MPESERTVAPVFNEARDKIAFLETRLNESEQKRYAEFVKAQERAKEEQEQKAARAKAVYDQEKEKHPAKVKNYDPPIKIKDPHLRRLALQAQAEHSKVTNLERSQIEDRLRTLERMDQQRGKQEQFRESAQQMSKAREAPERSRATSQTSGQQQETALSRAFAKAKAQEQAREHTHEQQRSPERERSR